MMQQASTQTVQRGRIIRDDQGNILSVEIPDENPENTSSCTPWGKPFEAETAPASIQPKTTLVKSLESLSETATKKIRHASKGEFATLKALVATYGEDIEAMARDRRRNVMQRTPGQIKAAIHKAGGFEALQL